MLAALARSQSPGSEATISRPGASSASLSAKPWARRWPVMLPDRPSITSTGPLASAPSCSTRYSAPCAPAATLSEPIVKAMSTPASAAMSWSRLASRSTTGMPASVACLEAGQQVGRVDRRGDHDVRLALEHGGADVELRLGGLIGFDGLEVVFDARCLGAVLHALLHRTPERVRERLQEHAVELLILGACARGPQRGRRRHRRERHRALQHASSSLGPPFSGAQRPPAAR